MDGILEGQRDGAKVDTATNGGGGGVLAVAAYLFTRFPRPGRLKLIPPAAFCLVEAVKGR